MDYRTKRLVSKLAQFASSNCSRWASWNTNAEKDLYTGLKFYPWTTLKNSTGHAQNFDVLTKNCKQKNIPTIPLVDFQSNQRLQLYFLKYWTCNIIRFFRLFATSLLIMYYLYSSFTCLNNSLILNCQFDVLFVSISSCTKCIQFVIICGAVMLCVSYSHVMRRLDKSSLSCLFHSLIIHIWRFRDHAKNSFFYDLYKGIQFFCIYILSKNGSILE